MTESKDQWEIEIDRLLEKIARLERKVRELESRRMLDSWAANPDRSGGAYTAQEISDANTWR